MSTKLHLPPPLKEAIKNDNLVIFVGAGLSCNFINKQQKRIGDWANLVDQLFKHLQDNGHDLSSIEQNEEAVKNIEPIDRLRKLASINTVSPSEIEDFAAEFYTLNEDVNDFSLHNKIMQITNKVITTNYDRAFEIANVDLDLKVAHKGKNSELVHLNIPDSFCVFKLHGCINDPDKMVIMPSQYEALYKNKDEDADAVRTSHFLECLVYTKQILFVGCGLGDPQINSFFNKVSKILGNYNRLKPYVITKEVLREDLDCLPIYINDYSEIENYIDMLLNYKKEFINSKNQEIINELRGSEDIVRKNAFRHAVEKHKKRLLIDALEWYEHLLLLSPKSYEAYSNMAVIYRDQEKNKQALECYQKALDINPQFTAAHFNMGNLYKQEDKNHAAIECYQKAIKFNSKLHQAYTNMGVCFINLKDYQQAISVLTKSLEIDEKEYRTYYILGIAYDETEDYRSAIRCYQKAMNLNPAFEDSFERLKRTKRILTYRERR